jgi:hypothetical protein
VEAVQNAFASIEKACIRAETAKTRAVAAGVKDRNSETAREARVQSSVYKEMFDKKIAQEKEATRARNVVNNDYLATVKKNAAAEVSAEKAAIAEGRAQRNFAHAQYIKGEKEKTDAVTRETKKRADAVTRGLERERDAAQAARRQFATAIGSAGAQGLASGIRTSAGIAGQIVNTAMQVGGGFTVAGALTERLSAQKSAQLLANAAYDPSAIGKDGKPDMFKRTRQDPNKILDKARAVAISTGTDVDELMEGTHAYVSKASDLKGGMANMEFFAKLAKGNGAKFGEVTNAFGMIKAQNEGISDEDARSMMLNVVAQGRKGAIEMPDVAHVASKITKSSSNYAMNQSEAQRQLLGLAQIAIKTSGSPAEAATSISNFSDDMHHHGSLYGIKSNKQGKIEGDMADNFAQIFRAAHGNTELMSRSEAKGGFNFTKRSFKMLQAVSTDYDEAYKNASGDENAKNEAGAKAVHDKIAGTTAATYSIGDAEEDAKLVLQQPGEKLAAVLRQLGDKMATALLPSLEKFIPALEKMIPTFVMLGEKAVPAFMSVIKSIADFVGANSASIATLAEHPIGTIIAAEVTASIMKAAIGQGIKDVLLSMMTKTAGAGAVPGAGGIPGAGGAAAGGGAGLAVAGGAIMTGAFFSATSDRYSSSASSKADEIKKQVKERLAKGDIGGASALLKEQEDKAGAGNQIGAGLQKASKYASYLTGPLGMAASYASDNIESAITGKEASGTRKTAETMAATDIVDAGELRALIAEAVVGGVRDGVAIVDPSAPNRSGPTVLKTGK